MLSRSLGLIVFFSQYQYVRTQTLQLGSAGITEIYVEPVSYTHLDVYKRQTYDSPITFLNPSNTPLKLVPVIFLKLT